MLEKEISEIYRFSPSSFNKMGRNEHGVRFRDVVKDFERDFHSRHSTEYALNLYANANTMRLLAKSCDAAPFLTYGMDLTQGRAFDPLEDPYVNHEMDKCSQTFSVYGIDSAFMTDYDEYNYPIIDEEKGIFPLTLLIDWKMNDGEVRLAVPTFDSDEHEEVIVDEPILEYA